MSSSYIGAEPVDTYSSLAVQHFTTSVTTSYSLSQSVTSENDIRLTINSVVQQPGSSYAYTCSGTTLTLSSATASSDTMHCVFIGKSIGTTNPPDGSVGASQLTTNAVTESKIANDSITGAKLNMPLVSGDIIFANGTDSMTRLAKGADGEYLKLASGVPSWGSANGAFESQLLHVEERRATNTNAGTFNTGSDQTRVLTTVVTNEITSASLGSNQITLPAGTFICDASAPAYNVLKHRVQIYNVTGSAVLLSGSACFSHTADSDQDRSVVFGKFTLGGSTVIELQHRCGATVSGNGLGVLTNFAPHETYAIVKIWKVG